MKMWVIYKLTQDQTDELMLSKARPLLAKIKKTCTAVHKFMST